MKLTPRRITFSAAKLILMLCALFSGVNIVLINLSSGLIMPLALSSTGYLAKAGIRMAAESGNGFFSVYSTVLAAIACAAMLVCAIMSGRRAGWLTAALIIFLADCAGIAMLIFDQGYRSGYWFELVGHGVVLAAFILACCTFPKKEKAPAEDIVSTDAEESE